MKKSMFIGILFGLIVISLIGFVSAEEFSLCSQDSDCGGSYTKNYCSGNSLCSDTITPICLNPGTTNSLCSSDSAPVCKLCANSCKEGICVEETISEPKPEPVQTCAAKIKVSSNQKIYYLGDSLEITVEIFDSEGNLLPNYPFKGEMYDNKWSSLGPPGKTTEQGYLKHKGIVDENFLQKAVAIEGKIKFKTSTYGLTECEGIEDILEIEVRKSREKEEVCGIGVCVPEEEKIKKVENISEEKKEKIFYSCSGCELNDKCYPPGYRKEGEYCSMDYRFVIQREGVCDNNFECKSNVCISGECVGENLIKKIIKWFKKLFGQEEPEKGEESELCSKLLIEKNIGDYEYKTFSYGEHKEEQVPFYSEQGEQIGIVKCCAALYNNGNENAAVLVCPFDSREDIENTLKKLLEKGEIISEKYIDKKVYKVNGKNVIVWSYEKFIIAVGGPKIPLQEDVADVYLKKYPNDLGIRELPTVKEPVEKAKDEFIAKLENPEEVIFVNFETLPDGTVLQNGAKLTGKEWESLEVIFETPSEEYLKVFGAKYPFNPLDKLSLSPGFGPFEDGSDTDDDLDIIFSKPVKAAGIYLLDLGETDERESITFFDKDGNIIEKISPWPKSTFGNPAPGTFVSLIHEGISKIEILENTKDSDDIAYDNLYFVK